MNATLQAEQRVFQKPAPSVRVVSVDDSAVIRQIVKRMLDSESGCELVGTARNGREALAVIKDCQPDLVLLDVEMPEMNGIELLQQLRLSDRKTRVIMFSSITQAGAKATMNALLAGADDYLSKPTDATGADAFTAVRSELIAKIHRLFRRSTYDEVAPKPSPFSKTQPFAAPVISRKRKQAPSILAIGVSTGGPAALADILPSIPADFPLPIVIVQHMSAFFTPLLADRLSARTKMPVVEAKDGDEVCPGRMLLAPGNYHLRFAKNSGKVIAKLDQEAQEHSCRPSVDVMFRSAADIYGGSVLATVLTGMGQDGIHGARLLKSLGATVFAQDKESSVVWGMPGAIVQAQLADAVLPLTKIVPAILEQL